MILQLMSKDLNLDAEYIMSVADNNTAYKKYKINKKNGHKRDIYHPSKNLKVLQYWVVKKIFSLYPISQYSKAYSKGNSIRKNALVHRNSKYIVHLDIKNFFESINCNHVDKLLNKINNIDEDDKELIKKIVLYKGEYLVVGSVASPIISNCVMYEFDKKIEKEILNETSYKYTRYADDIIISDYKYIDKQIIERIKEILKEYDFNLNEEKTYFMNKSNRRVVTGVVIDNNNNKLGIGSKKYRDVKKMLYEYLIKNKGEKDKIHGYLSLIKDLDYEKYNSIRNTYSRYDKNNIIFKI